MNAKRVLNVLFYALIGSYCLFVASRKAYQWYNQKQFVAKIKKGEMTLKNADNFLAYKGYSLDSLLDQPVYAAKEDSSGRLGDFIHAKNVFVHFWFKGCRECQIEMPAIEAFHAKYGDKIAFVLVTNDSPAVVKAYAASRSSQVPMYSLATQIFPEGVWVFPTSHLMLKGVTKFNFAGIGNFDNAAFYEWLDGEL
jgi:thiol-disulfide isomerase/thioredoxin